MNSNIQCCARFDTDHEGSQIHLIWLRCLMLCLFAVRIKGPTIIIWMEFEVSFVSN